MKLQSLPRDIQILVVEFITIDDCYALKEADNKFLNTLQLPESFWAKKVYEKHIQYLNKTLNTFKLFKSSLPYYVPTSLEFNNFRNAKTLWEGWMQSQKRLSTSLEVSEIEKDRTKDFCQGVCAILTDPRVPLPSLRRETEYIPTSSCFENFLTEIDFNTYPKSSPYDENCSFLEEVCGLMYGKLERNLQRIKAGEIATVGRRFLKTYEGRQTQRSNRIRLENVKKTKAKIEEVLAGAQSLVRSHCKIIKNYLLSLKENRVLLKEYDRCWKEFTYSLIEMNSLTKSYEDVLKMSSNKSFSTWKGMVQVWVDEVHNEVSVKLTASFHTLLIDVIKKEVVGKCNSLKQKRFAFDEEEMDCQERDNEKTVKLLLKSFIAFSDISLQKDDETMCDSQPKLNLINYLTPKIKNIIEASAVTEVPSKMNEILNVVRSVLYAISNGEISLEQISQGSSLLKMEKNRI